MLCDLNNDTFLEIVFVASEDTLSNLYAIDANGVVLEGFPILFTERIIEGPSSADFNNNGYDEIVIVGNSGNIFKINGYGEISNGFPSYIPAIPIGAPTISDIDSLTGKEIIVPTKNDGIHKAHDSEKLTILFSSVV